VFVCYKLLIIKKCKYNGGNRKSNKRVGVIKIIIMKNHEEFEILELEDRLEMSRRCFKWAPHHYYCMAWIDIHDG
jgi:hypothetical protein